VDENLSETEKLINFTSAKFFFITLATYFLLRTSDNSGLPVVQPSLVTGMLSVLFFNL
jgi:hypothetical protein